MWYIKFEKIKRVGYMKKTLVKEEKIGPFDIFFANGLAPLPHLHNNVELIFVIEGSATAHSDRDVLQISTGDLFVSFPNQVLYYENSTLGDYCVCIFATDTFFGNKEIIMDNVPQNSVIKFDKNPNICDALRRLRKVIHGSEKYPEVLAAGLINVIFGEILGNLELKPRIKTDNFTLQNILNYCTLNFNLDLTLDDVAEALHLSKYYISHLFNKKLGIGFNTYLNRLRVTKSCDLLEDTDKKIVDIVQESGFNSIRSFNRAFFGIMNMTPSDYRKSKKISNH